ncbi:MAG: D-glycero-beta-D-manno-heptose-1,7-bisphosphate 7-phosphatase, partial [Rickettsiales bacterium]|nr:D-glycero-beta-D-manno-heptose-1,7-bisphosphate 7-phosphatase [Rickettsiales bacterium]
MLVLLDRDGVINEDLPKGVCHLDEWSILPGAAEAIAQLTSHHVKVAVVTNQSAIGKGWLQEA